MIRLSFQRDYLASVWRKDQTEGKTRGTEDVRSNSLGKDKDDLGKEVVVGRLRRDPGKVHKKGKPRVSNHETPQNTDSINIYRVPDTVCSSQQDRCMVPALVTQLISDWYQSWKLYLYVLNPDPSLVCFPPDTPAQADPVSYDSLGLLPLMPV